MPHPLNAQRGRPTIEFQGQTPARMIAEFMDENDVPGMTLAIVQAPYITEVSGFGIVDLDSRRLASSRTLYDVGQMNEAYFAVATLQLVEAGKLTLDAPLSKLLPDAPAAWGAVLLGQLLQHQSGLPVTGQIPEQPAAPEFVPGSEFRQTPLDYQLVIKIAEKASGKSIQQLVKEDQIDRLGLRDTIFSGQSKDVQQEGIAAGQRHAKFLQEAVFINPAETARGYFRDLSPAGEASETSIFATAEDVSVWDIGLAGGILIKDPALRKVLYQPAKLTNGNAVASSGPWYFPGHPGLMISTGSAHGFSSLLSRFTHPNELVCVTLLANKEGLDLTQLARRIAGAYNPNVGPPDSSRGRRVQQSPWPVKETMDRLELSLKAGGVTIMARIDHAKAAAEVGMELAPNEELIFGNPKAGTILMQLNPGVSVDLPLRASAWEKNGQVWLIATDPVELMKANGLNEPIASRMRQALDAALLRAVQVDPIE